MKQKCIECKMLKDKGYCISYPYPCKNFTLFDNLVELKQRELLNERTKQELYNRFFKAIVGYLDLSYEKNIRDDILMYYSIDHDIFIKILKTSKRERGHWLEIPINSYKLYYFKQKLGYYEFANGISQNGRLVNNNPVKDDIFIEFKTYIDNVFQAFFRQYGYKEMITKSLF